jgi:hypothetical protein
VPLIEGSQPAAQGGSSICADEASMRMAKGLWTGWDQRCDYRNGVKNVSRSADASDQRQLIDADRSGALFLLAHNPKVAGSNPAPATTFPRVSLQRRTPFCSSSNSHLTSRT